MSIPAESDPFVGLQLECKEHDMVSEVDYRQLAQHRRGLYFTGDDACKILGETFESLTNKEPIKSAKVPVQMGRTLTVPKAGARCALTWAASRAACRCRIPCVSPRVFYSLCPGWSRAPCTVCRKLNRWTIEFRFDFVHPRKIPFAIFYGEYAAMTQLAAECIRASSDFDVTSMSSMVTAMRHAVH